MFLDFRFFVTVRELCIEYGSKHLAASGNDNMKVLKYKNIKILKYKSQSNY